VIWGLAPGSADGPLPSVIDLSQPPAELVPGRNTYTEVWGPYAGCFFGWSMDGGNVSFDEIDDFMAGMPGFFEEGGRRARLDGSSSRGPVLTAGGFAGFPGDTFLASLDLIDTLEGTAGAGYLPNYVDNEFLWGEGVAIGKFTDDFFEQ